MKPSKGKVIVYMKLSEGFSRPGNGVHEALAQTRRPQTGSDSTLLEVLEGQMFKVIFLLIHSKCQCNLRVTIFCLKKGKKNNVQEGQQCPQDSELGFRASHLPQETFKIDLRPYSALSVTIPGNFRG